MSPQSPSIWLGGDASVSETAHSLSYDYAQLIAQGPSTFGSSGAKVLRMWSGAIATAWSGMASNGGSEQTYQANLALLQAIATYCRDNGIVVSVEDTFTGGWNYQWIEAAKAVGLPVAYVDGGENLFGVPDNAAALSSLANTEVGEAKAIIQAFPGIELGDVETPVTVASGDQLAWEKELQDWWSAFDNAAKAAGIPGFSYFDADMSWDTQDDTWQTVLERMSPMIHATGMDLNVFINGTPADVSSTQWTAQAEQHVAQIAQDPAIGVDNVIIETWEPAFPAWAAGDNTAGTMSNLATETAAIYPAYQSGAVTAQAPGSLIGPSQLLITMGQSTSVALTLQTSGIAGAGSAGVVLVARGGILSASAHGSGSVSGSGTSVLTLTGTPADLKAELSGLALTESTAGPDTIDVQLFGADGLVQDKPIQVVSTPPTVQPESGNYTLSFTGSSPQEPWVSSSAIIGNSGRILAENETWGGSNTGYSTVQDGLAETFPVVEPLAEGDLTLVSGVAVAAAAQGNPGFDPTFQTSNGEVRTYQVSDTARVFEPSSGESEIVVETLMPDPVAPTVPGGTIPNYFATGGLAVTVFSVTGNPFWNSNASGVAFVTTVYDSAYKPVERFTQYQSGSSIAAEYQIFDPGNGQLWQDIQSVRSENGFVTGPKVITEYNTGDNPNWDYIDGIGKTSLSVTYSDFFVQKVTWSTQPAGNAGTNVTSDLSKSDLANLLSSSGAKLDSLILALSRQPGASASASTPASQPPAAKVSPGLGIPKTASVGTSSASTPITQPVVPKINLGLAIFNTTIAQPVSGVPQRYTGPVSNLQEEYISVTNDSLNMSVSTPGWFIHSGSGDDALAASSGTNVLDGGTGSNFLTGGSGTDTFFVDDRAATADIWSTIVNFHVGDAATLWGVTPSNFALAWQDGQGASGYTGLTLHASAAGKPFASMTFAGFTQADLVDGRLTLSFGIIPASDSAYLYVHANS